ncbi:MAG: hypothetical protein SO146_02405 [Eubacteriales bacterium]|nr:hypothetical protein [Clostridiales bacterium]MDY2951184.1 hypothetical protein [Eubacteriales bacterium]MDY3822363.1 hypothetical protein [Eubacteriales bacterium]MDY4896092.1 hypothetical protein [Eubacteriales bacterium]
MTDQILRDKFGKKIGTIKTDYNGIQTIYDALNRKKGTYDPRTNTTRDSAGRSIGKGNLLAMLLNS